MPFISPIKYPLSIVRNQDLLIEIPVTDEDGNAWDWTNPGQWTGKAEVRDTSSSATVLLTFETPTTMDLTTNGILQITLPAASLTVNEGKYVWDVRLNDSTIERILITESTFTIIDNVTEA